MGRPVITRAVKRTRHWLAGNLANYNGADLKALAVEEGIALAEKAAQKMVARIKSRVAKRKAKKAPADDTQ